MTTKRGLASPWVHSALATTRRWRLQLSRVEPGEVPEAARRLTGPAAQLGRLGEFAFDLADQPAVARQPEQEVDAPAFAPRHQSVAGKAAIGTQQDAHLGPAAADLGDKPRHLLDRPGRAVDVGRAQFGRQQMPPTEDIERQVAVIVVIAVEEAPLLMPVQRIIGGVEIEDDLFRRHDMRVEKDIDQQPLDRRRIVAEFVIARGFRPAQLQSVERRFAGHRRAIPATGRKLAGQHRHHRVVAQFVVVDQILVTQRNPKDPLPNQSRNRVLDQLRRAAVLEAAGKPRDHTDRPVGRAKQHRAGVRGHRAAVEPSDNRTPLDRCKAKQIRATLCRHRASP